VRDEIWRPAFASREQAYLGFLRSRRIGTNCGLAFRAGAFAAVGGFDETFRGGAEDTDLLIRLARAFDFEVIPEVLVKLHMHDGGHLRRVTPLQAQGYERILEKNAAALRRHPRLDAELHYKTGWLHCHAGGGRAGRRHLLAALRRRPTLLRAWVGLVLFTALGSRAGSVHRRLSAWRRRDTLDFPAAPSVDAREAR
jgi:GT2 family glycosyltransferase